MEFNQFVRCDFRQKDERRNQLFHSYLTRAAGMFDYETPLDIDWYEVERLAQCGGVVGIAPYKGDRTKPVILPGSLAGLPDSAGYRYRWMFASAVLDWSPTEPLEEGKDVVIIRNTIDSTPLSEFLAHYIELQCETELSLYLANVNSRVQQAIIAGNDADKLAAELFLADVEDGKLGAIMSSSIFKAISTTPMSGHTNGITDLIELLQYTRAGAYNEIGIDANTNLKREAISVGESSQGSNMLQTLPDIMLKSRERSLKHFEAVFGVPCTVSFAGQWKRNEQMAENLANPAAEEEQEAEPEEAEGEENV